ncbi:hypothetical protein PV350_33855 [Streptomyces sp. PA03-6a]|nr:hypothetical protein [Streptomyces sp. PA03-6a]
MLAAYDYRSRAEAHADGVCARLFAIARRARTTGVVEMADHSINGDYGHEPIPTPPPTPPPAGSVTHTYAADDACPLCGWWRCRCGETGSAVPQTLAAFHA